MASSNISKSQSSRILDIAASDDVPLSFSNNLTQIDDDFFLAWSKNNSLAGSSENSVKGHPIIKLTPPSADFDPNAIDLFDVPFIDGPHHDAFIKSFHYIDDDKFWGKQDASTVHDVSSDTKEDMSLNTVARQMTTINDSMDIDQWERDVSDFSTTSNVDIAMLGFQTIPDNNFILNIGYGQRSNTDSVISATGYGAQAPLPASMPSTSEELNVDAKHSKMACVTSPPALNISGAHHVYPSTIPTLRCSATTSPSTFRYPSLKWKPSSLYGPFAKRATPRNTGASVKRKYNERRLPAPELYTVSEKGGFVCRYKGPALSGKCSIRTLSTRSLGRHLRNHALKEVAMNLPPEDRVACNGMPEGLLLLKVSCPFQENELAKCKFYRENGKRWEVKTLKRWERIMESHKAECHDDQS